MAAPDLSKSTYINFDELATEFNFQDAGHLCETHIMGTSSLNSIFNKHQKSWDQNNLYIIECGSVPSIGTQNPTLSMTALTLISFEAILADIS